MSKRTVALPILVNQTDPILLELIRIDLDTSANETITVSAKELKKLKKQADKDAANGDLTNSRLLHYPVKQAGLYRLHKILDESNLEVHKVASDTLVAQCPTGIIKPVSHDKCRGELSDFYLHVDATPPLKVKYSRSINQEDQSYVHLTVHPENLETPLARQESSHSLLKLHNHGTDASWAKARRVEIPINETLGVVGEWIYSLDEIQDGCGNVVNYTFSDASRSPRPVKNNVPQQRFVVHDRPRAILDGCNPQDPLKVAKGKSQRLPVRLNPTGHHSTHNALHYISYSFAIPIDGQTGGIENQLMRIEQAVIGPDGRSPEISEAGIYSLMSIATDYCKGEVLEPSSCLLLNPPEPELSVTSEGIPHQCAGNSVGLRVNLDFIGTPPFEISYNIYDGGRRSAKVERVKEMRTQLEFKPRNAGHYVYEFLDIADAVYRTPRSLKQANIKLEQDVKPTAWASFVARSPHLKTCIQEPATFDIHLSGEAPWVLEYDLVHDGKRTKHKVTGIEQTFYTLTSPNLNHGGQYSLSLTSVADASGCRIHLKDEAKVEVRFQRPSAAFGLVEGRRSVFTLEGKDIDVPLRLSGEPPWTVTYSKLDSEDTVFKRRLEAANDVLIADDQAVYQLRDVADKFCPGTVDDKASQFEIRWIPRPTVNLADSSTIEWRGNAFHKKAVCEGDQDAIELSFSGNPPYYLRYDVHVRPQRGPASVRTKQDKFGLHAATIRMDTSQPGGYEYRLSELGDQLYDRGQSNSALVVYQKVNGRPGASFVKPGKTYNYCKEDAFGDEVIPIALTGSPPFSLEITIKHHASTTPEIVNVPSIESSHYDFHIPHSALSLGMHTVSIGKVSDSNGCQRGPQSDGKITRVSVVDVPSISPMESAIDFCVGDRISYTLGGTPPFNVYYTFEGVERKASASTNSFRRIAEKPGNFTITAISDKASSDSCRARTVFTKIIHALPSVRISKGKTTELDIHEGGRADLLFEFEGTPPFEFT